MKTENVSFPYPVLGISDDILPSLEETGCADPDITIVEEGESFRISVSLKLMNSDILNYISDESAEYSVEVSCHSTMLRKCITSAKPDFSFTIEKKLLNGKMEFESYVIVKNDIVNYKNMGLNPDYEGHIINLHKGDVLVAYKKCSIPLDLDLRNIRNIKSFMSVQRNSRENEHSVMYDLDSPKILILLPDKMMDEYNKKPANNEDGEKRKGILKASLYLQALTYALLNYHKYKEEKGYTWVNALTYRMNEPDLREHCKEILHNESSDNDSQNMDNLFKLAQMMLNQPYMGMLKQISISENTVGKILTED